MNTPGPDVCALEVKYHRGRYRKFTARTANDDVDVEVSDHSSEEESSVEHNPVLDYVASVVRESLFERRQVLRLKACCDLFSERLGSQ